MPERTARAEWKGDLPDGSGNMAFGGGAFEGQFSFGSRFEEGEGTNPEELIVAAHAGCFSMQLSGVLGQAGRPRASCASNPTITLFITESRAERNYGRATFHPCSITTQLRASHGYPLAQGS